MFFFPFLFSRLRVFCFPVNAVTGCCHQPLFALVYIFEFFCCLSTQSSKLMSPLSLAHTHTHTHTHSLSLSSSSSSSYSISSPWCKTLCIDINFVVLLFIFLGFSLVQFKKDRKHFTWEIAEVCIPLIRFILAEFSFKTFSCSCVVLLFLLTLSSLIAS